MPSPVLSRRMWKLHAHGQQIVVRNGVRERFVHPLMKALIWALYLPQYPTSQIEVPIDDKYKPDVVAFDPAPPIYQVPEPIFWGEAGRVGRDKIASLVRRYADTHFVVAKWDRPLTPYIDIVREALDGQTRTAPFDLIAFPEQSIETVDDKGHIHITFDDVERVQLTPA